ncbi:MAG: hypothetical protein WDW38_002868 [Sanguina aurantia]
MSTKFSPQQLAMSGDQEAMVRAGHMLLAGYGVRQDTPEAALWLQEAWAIQNYQEPRFIHDGLGGSAVPLIHSETCGGEDRGGGSSSGREEGSDSESVGESSHQPLRPSRSPLHHQRPTGPMHSHRTRRTSDPGAHHRTAHATPNSKSCCPTANSDRQQHSGSRPTGIDHHQPQRRQQQRPHSSDSQHSTSTAPHSEQQQQQQQQQQLSQQQRKEQQQQERPKLEVHTLYSKLGWQPHTLLTDGAVNEAGVTLQPPSAHVTSCLSALTKAVAGSMCSGSQACDGGGLDGACLSTVQQQHGGLQFPAAVTRLGLGRSRSMASLSLHGDYQ